MTVVFDFLRRILTIQWLLSGANTLNKINDAIWDGRMNFAIKRRIFILRWSFLLEIFCDFGKTCGNTWPNTASMTFVNKNVILGHWAYLGTHHSNGSGGLNGGSSSNGGNRPNGGSSSGSFQGPGITIGTGITVPGSGGTSVRYG